MDEEDQTVAVMVAHRTRALLFCFQRFKLTFCRGRNRSNGRVLFASKNSPPEPDKDRMCVCVGKISGRPSGKERHGGRELILAINALDNTNTHTHEELIVNRFVVLRPFRFKQTCCRAFASSRMKIITWCSACTNNWFERHTERI